MARYGSVAFAALAKLAELVRAEARLQNLVASSTLATMWGRHLVDSAQLVDFCAEAAPGPWVDIGSGAGFPGLVVALLSDRPVVLLEPRRSRARFLAAAAFNLGISERVEVHQANVEQVTIAAAIISARAVAPLGKLFEIGITCATPQTSWVLPKGRSAHEEVASAAAAWHGVFHVEQSITDPQSLIVLASGVSRR